MEWIKQQIYRDMILYIKGCHLLHPLATNLLSYPNESTSRMLKLEKKEELWVWLDKY